jgi:hypothetical protein
MFTKKKKFCMNVLDMAETNAVTTHNLVVMGPFVCKYDTFRFDQHVRSELYSTDMNQNLISSINARVNAQCQI